MMRFYGRIRLSIFVSYDDNSKKDVGCISTISEAALTVCPHQMAATPTILSLYGNLDSANIKSMRNFEIPEFSPGFLPGLFHAEI